MTPAQGVVSILLLFLLATCQSRPPTQHHATQLNLALSQEPSTLDIQRTSEPAVTEVLNLVCETLLAPGPEAYSEPQPWLAQHWIVATNGLSMTVTLRPDITFHDGTPLTAQAVQASFERLLDDASVMSPVHEELQGVKIRAVNNWTVVFELSEPRSDFISLLTNPYPAIIAVPPTEQEAQQFARRPVCTGPYRVQTWQTAQSILLTRNPDYHWPPPNSTNQGPALIDSIRVSFVERSDIRYEALLKHEVDVLSLSTPEQVAEIRSRPNEFRLYESWVSGISFIGFNYERSPTNELLVRQALATAIDKGSIVHAVLAGLAEPAIAPLSPNMFSYTIEVAESGYSFDPQQSRIFLTQAGFTDSDGDGVLDRNGEALALTLLTTTSSTYEKIFTLLQDQLKDIGVQLTMCAVPAAEIADITPTGEFDLLLYHYNWGSPDALQLFLGTERIGASNRVAYSNPQVDELLRHAEEYPANSPEKAALLVEAQHQILHDAPWQPLLTRKLVTAVNVRIQGIQLSPSGGLLWHDAYITNPE